jgi:hypothetical protein
VDSYPLLSQAPIPVEVELGCDNKLNGEFSAWVNWSEQLSLCQANIVTTKVLSRFFNVLKVVQGCSRFFKVFQGFSKFFKVFQGFPSVSSVFKCFQGY